MKSRHFLENVAFIKARPSQFIITPAEEIERTFYIPETMDIPDDAYMGREFSDTKNGRVGFTSIQTKDDASNYVYTKEQVDEMTAKLQSDLRTSVEKYADFLERTAPPPPDVLSVSFSIVRKD